MRRVPSTVLAAVLVTAALSACGGAAAEPDDPLVAALCAAVEAPDAARAARLFEQDVHQPLHELADEVAPVDRSITTSLLEAKHDVETAMRDADAPDARVRQRLEVLADHTRAALDALDHPVPAC